MKHRPFVLARALALTAILALACTLAHAQGTATATLSGVVVDPGGGVIPGAAVLVKNEATGTRSDVVTNKSGAFSVPALNPGTYTVTVSLMGFKTSVVRNVKLVAASPADVKVKLELGGIEETVVVIGGTELVQTRSATIAQTVNVDQINNLPLATRNAMNFVTMLAGVNTTGINRDSNFNGLPSSATAISLDGVNNNENYNKSTEGLFAMITPRQDAVEAVTVTTGVPGSESGGHGAVSINFVTRSGTDKFSGSAYEYYRGPWLNTNYYFNQLRGLPKNQVKINQYGFRLGGPVLVPKVYNGHGKAFFFVNYEEFRMPNSFSRTRTILTPEAQLGVFKYGSNAVNLYQLALAKGLTATPDPTLATLLNTIRAATATTGTVTQASDPNTMAYDFLSGGAQVEKQPTVRMDYNIGSKHRITGTWTHQLVDRDPDHLNSADARFPGSPNYRHYVSDRNLSSGALRSVLKGNLVNELRGGLKWGPSYFGKYEWQGPATFADEGGRALVFPNVGQTLTSWYTDNGPTGRSAWSWNIDESLDWQKGNHNLKFGASYFDGRMWSLNQTIAPQINFGVNDNDPATAMFNTTNFPGASSTQLTNAKNLYALLTGRVTTITADARLDEGGTYQLLGARTMRLRQQEFGVFAQDLWRVNQKLTVNAGLRWDLQLPIAPSNSVMSTSYLTDLCGVSGVGSQYACNMYQPGTLTGVKPTYVQYNQGSPGYQTDWNNFGPSIGMAFRPYVEGGFWRRVLGNPDQATFRAGYSIAYTREGMALYYGVYSGNQGSTYNVTRSATLSGENGIVRPGETWPVLLRDESKLSMPPYPASPTYPISATAANNISIFSPDIQVAQGRSVNISFQRAVTKDMAFEIRYNGTWGRNIWTQEDLNLGDINGTENKFIDEFKLAQQNLQANLAAGRGSNKGANFAYYGPGTGTSPLPIVLAYFSGVPAAQAGDAAKYTSTQFSNSTFLNPLSLLNPQPLYCGPDPATYACTATNTTPSFAYQLFNDATRRANAIAAGLPPNFFLVNPDVSRAFIYKSTGYTNYNAVQLELRRRMSAGLQFTVNYQFAKASTSRSLGQRYGLVDQLNTGVPRHALKAMWDWNIPVGRGRHVGTDMSRVLDAVVGGWEFHGSARLQNRWIDFGNVRVVGMTIDELRDAYRIRYGNDPVTGVAQVYILPQDITDNTRKAFSTDPTSATGYSSLGAPTGRYLAPANSATCMQLELGDCAPLNTYALSPLFARFDVSLAKKFRLIGRSSFEMRLDVMNVFNNINFIAVASPTTGTPFTGGTYGQVTSAYTDMSNTFDPGGRLGQLVFRFSW